MNRRKLLASAAFVPAVFALDACSSAQTSTLQADLNAGILDSGLIVQSLSTVESDIKLDAPKSITPAQDAQFQKDLLALQQANTSLTALGGSPLPSAAQTPLQQIVTAFNDFAAVANAVLPAAEIAFPQLGAVVITFQAATLIVQTVIVPLMMQIAANNPTGPKAALTPRVAVPARFLPPPSMTLAQARATLGLAAARRRGH